MGQAGTREVPFPFEFPGSIWSGEVERLSRRSPARQQAERARRQVEAGRSPLRLLRCSVEGRDGTAFPHCWKLYLPLDAVGASAAPFAFVFRLAAIEERLVLRFAAFGERHPANRRTRSVYHRAHKNLHGRYP